MSSDVHATDRPRLQDPWLFALLALGLGLRVIVAWWLDAGMRPRGDELTYLVQAASLRDSGTLDTGFFVRPPLYFVWLAGMGWLADLLDVRFGLLVKLAQSLVGVVAALPVYRSALRLADRRTARLAVAFLLFDPTLVAYTHLFWPETLYLLAVAIVFDGIADLDERSTARVAGLGLTAGIALLLKPAFGLFTLLLAGHWLQRLGWAGALRRVLVFGGVAAVVVAPWVVRNQLLYGPVILMENQGPYNLWIGNDPAPPRRILESWKVLPDAATRSRVATQRGLEAIAEAPGRFARNSVVRAANLWGLEFFVLRHVVSGGYGPVSRETALFAFWVIQTAYAAALLCAALGLQRLWRDPTQRLLLIYALVFTAVVATMVTTTRFRVPFSFPLSIAAGLGVDRVLRRQIRRPDLATLGLACALLAFSASRPLFRTFASGDFDDVRELAKWSWWFFRY